MESPDELVRTLKSADGKVTYAGGGTALMRVELPTLTTTTEVTVPPVSTALQFSLDGKFISQIGGRDKSKGNTDPNNPKEPADIFVDAKTNEAYIADGYGNRRVLVLDADSGKFKRMWGAFGNKPLDPPPAPSAPAAGAAPAAPPALETTGRGPEQFGIVHSVEVSKDGFVYVADRANRRVQVFKTDGTYVNQVFINRGVSSPNTAAGIAFSPDEKRLYIADSGAPKHIRVFDVKTDGALASGSVTFSDGVTGKWMVDQYGRPGFTKVSQPGYRPKPEDAQAFMQELSLALQQRGVDSAVAAALIGLLSCGRTLLHAAAPDGGTSPVSKCAGVTCVELDECHAVGRGGRHLHDFGQRDQLVRHRARRGPCASERLWNASEFEHAQLE